MADFLRDFLAELPLPYKDRGLPLSSTSISERRFPATDQYSRYTYETLLVLTGRSKRWKIVARVKRYVQLDNKYLKDAQSALAHRDHLQAPEKLRGATAQAVKATAAERGIIIRSHGRLWDFVERLDQDYPDWRLAEKFSIASALHTNFYEGWMLPRIVERNAEAVKELIERLVSLS